MTGVVMVITGYPLGEQWYISGKVMARFRV